MRLSSRNSIFIAVTLALAGCAGPQSLSELFDPSPDATNVTPGTLVKLPPPPGLTLEEMNFWSVMSPKKQREALDFLNAGGSMAEFMRV